MSKDEHSDAGADALFRSHAPFVARFLYRLGVAAEDVDDAVQEVFLVAHRAGGYRRSRATKTTYLASIAVRAASTSRRRGRVHHARHGELGDDLASSSPSPVEVLEESEALRALRYALEQLAPPLRATLTLVDLEGQTCGAVAAAMAVPVGTVYWRLHRARAAFKSAVHEATQGKEQGPEVPARRKSPMAIPAMLLLRGSPAREVLQAGRETSPIRYDVARALPRHQGRIASAHPLPAWADPETLAAVKAAGSATTGSLGLVGAGALALLVIGGAVVLSEHSSHLSGAAEIRGGAGGNAPPTAALEEPTETEADSNHAPHEAFAQALEPPVPRPSARAGAPPRAPSPPARAALLPRGPWASPTRADASRNETGKGTDDSPRGSASSPGEGPSEAAGTSPPPAPPAAARSPDEMREMQEVAAAAAALPQDPARALLLVRATEARYPNGYMRVERRYLGIMALFALGRRPEARAEAARFLSDHPEGTFSRKIRAMVESNPDSAPPAPPR